MRRFLHLIFAFVLLTGCILRTSAAEVEYGSVEITVKYKGENISGGELFAVRLGYVDDEKNVFRNVVTDAEIEDIADAAKMQNFYSAYQKNFQFDVYNAIIKDGSAKFSDLPSGLYLIYQETPATGYEKLSAFMVSVPYNGEMNVTAVSKTALRREQEPEEGSSGSADEKLPQTGRLTWPIPWMALSGMICFVIGWLLCFGKKGDPQ